jgi:hypothetical protein
MSLETMTKLASYTVTTNNVTEIDFTNIPQTYTDLVIKVSARDTTTSGLASGLLGILFNGDISTSNLYSAKFLRGSGTAVDSLNNVNQQYLWVAHSPNTSYTSNVFSNVEVYIPNYSGNNLKNFSVDGVTENNASGSYVTLTSAIWNNTSPITSLRIYDYGGAYIFAQQTNITIYGIKNARKTAGNSIKATGGNIIFDGTYVYHVFNSTSAFVPTQPLIADVLVVAGGGGGASTFYSGGGGAGGLRGATSQSLTASTYTATIGSGGAASTSNGAAGGTTGSNSIFSGSGAVNIAASGGGGAGGSSSYPGKSGGSGGGATSLGANTNYAGGTGNAGGYSPVEGFDGGASQGRTGGYAGAGGGGGAGAVGQAGRNLSNGSYAGAGGVGSSAYSSWGAATGAGQNVSGTYYFAGGGGGGWLASAEGAGGSQGAGGFGGGGAGNYQGNGNSGTANTGGGGGGLGDGGSTWIGGNGGSGIIIVRYKG